MKTYLSALVIAAGFFVTTESSAQMGMMGQRGYGSSQTGMDRGIGVNQYGNGKKKPTNEKVDLLEQSLTHLEKQLTLDTFQLAVIKDLMVKNQTEETLVLNQEIPDEAKIEKFGVLRDRLDNEIKKILNQDQIDLF